MRVSTLVLLLLGGCAGLSESQCRDADWYKLGRRDSEIYEAAYALGWDDGNMDYRQRTGYGGGPM